MQYKHYIGIDVSKRTIDVTVLKEGDLLFHEKVANSDLEIRALIKRMTSEHKIRMKAAIFCVEHSGTYTTLLVSVLTRKKIPVWLESPLQIKLSLGLHRGKNDKLDSLRIAQYAYTFRKKSRLWSEPREVIEKLKKMRSLRQRLVSAQKLLKMETKEMKGFVNKNLTAAIESHCQASLDSIGTDILQVNKTILELITGDERLHQLFQWISSVTGVGNVLATEFLITTNEFKNFSNSKKFACYCGVAPFNYTSGTSLQGKGKISRHAHKRMKFLLHIASMSVVRFDGDYKRYYVRRVAEGKTKMSALNVIRNKIIHRVFACVRDQRTYTKEVLIT